MPANSLVIIDTGCANIASVKFATQRIGLNVSVSSDIAEIKKAERVILPGVGSAPAAMLSIQQKGLVECIQSLTQPVLGVCLGMQLMVTESEENHLGNHATIPCLNLIPGVVAKMQVGDLRLPHMGWNQVTSTQSNPLFEGIDDGTYFYFVHGYAVAQSDYTLATCHYHQTFSAAIHHNNFYGVQFHPERSSDAGAQLLKNFSRI